MTKHPKFPTTAESESVLAFPNASDTSLPGAQVAHEDDTPDGMPDGFRLLADGIYQLRPGEEDDLVPTRICSPLRVKGRCRRLDQAGWGSVVEIQDPDGNWHELIIDATVMSGGPASVVKPLLERGLVLSRATKAAESVKELLMGWQPVARYLRLNHLGWVDSDCTAFTLGDGRVLGGARVVSEHISDHVASAMHSRGTLQDWTATVAAPCKGNPLMVFVLSLAFSGPLLAVLGSEGGGFHLRGASSRGKSTLQKLAASVWGAPAFKQSWRSTDNAIESVAATCNDTLLVLDELHEVEPRDVGNIVYMLANGSGKIRSRADGNMQGVKRWTVQVLSSGEISLEEHMARANQKIMAGQNIRLIDMAADDRLHGAFDVLHGEPGGDAFAKRMNQAVKMNYGLAGPEFVERLIGITDKTQSLQSFIDKFCARSMTDVDAPADGQVQRVLRRFATVALAGEVATKFGLTDWRKGDAFSAARELFMKWFQERDTTTRTEISEAVARTRVYVAQNLGRFAELGSDVKAIDGWRDESWIYIRPECWRNIHAGSDPSEMARLHRTAGLLRTQKGNTLQFRMNREVGRARVYAVRAQTPFGEPG